MKEDIQRNSQQYDEDEIVLDLGGVLDDYIRCVRKYWKILLVLSVVVTGIVMMVMNLQYRPVYKAEIAYAVTRTGDTGIDASIAKRLSGTIPVITQSQKFREAIVDHTEGEIDKEEYEIASTLTSGTNLFSVSVTSDNADDVNRILDSFEQIYPEWADRTTTAVELQVVDKSQSGADPVNPRSQVKNLFFGVLAALALCFVFGTYYVLTVKTVRKESDMRKITERSCIGLIPDIKVKKRATSTKEQLLLTNKRLDWGFRQAVMSIQARVQKQMEQKNGKVLLMTSTISGEGKSVMAVNLALAFAEQEKKVLLIDGDLRKPSDADLLGVEEGTGLVEYLKGSAAKEQLVAECNGIHFLQAGKERGRASTLLVGSRMELLIEELRRRYDYIVIDTPPAYLFADAAMLARYADSVVYLVRHDMAEIREIRKGMAPFQSMEKLLGYLINRSAGGFSTYGKYSYGYGYGYGYGRYGKYGKYGKYKRYMELDEESMDTEAALNSESVLKNEGVEDAGIKKDR